MKPYRPHIPFRPIELTATDKATDKEKAYKRKKIKQKNVYAAMKEEGTFNGEIVEGSNYANILASTKNSYAAMKEEGTLHGEIVEGSNYANLRERKNDSRKDNYSSFLL